MNYQGTARDENTIYQTSDVDIGQRTSPLVVECQALGEGTDLLLKQIEELAIRLGPILSQANSPDVENAKNGKEPELSPHVLFLRSRNRLISKATDRIANILKRIDL